jgi:hypothetical protein
MKKGEDPSQGPHANTQQDDGSADEPYVIWLPADRMRVDVHPCHPDAQRAAAVFAELVCMMAGKHPRTDPNLARALRVVQEALGVSRDEFCVAVADLFGATTVPS